MADGIVKISQYGPKVVTMAVALTTSFLTGIRNNAGAIGDGAAEIGASFVSGIIDSAKDPADRNAVLDDS